MNAQESRYEKAHAKGILEAEVTEGHTVSVLWQEMHAKRGVRARATSLPEESAPQKTQLQKSPMPRL